MKKKITWKKTKLQTRPKSIEVYESSTGKILWVNKSNIQGAPYRVGGVDGRGFIKDVRFKTKKSAIKYLHNIIGLKRRKK